MLIAAMTDNLQPSVERSCRRCGETKSFEQFAIVYAKNSRGQNYRQHYCKECANADHAKRAQKYRMKNPEKLKRIRKEHRQRNLELVRRQRRESGMRLKLRVMQNYGGAICSCCSETCLSMLTIDHIYNDGARHRREIGKQYLTKNGNRALVADLYRWLERHNFPNGFQVLCYNCNLSKHRNKGVCEHALNEGSTTIPEGSSLEAIAKRKTGRRYAAMT